MIVNKREVNMRQYSIGFAEQELAMAVMVIMMAAGQIMLFFA